MDYISSDTNVWFDFFVIDRLELPFKLPYAYLMNSDAINDEILSPKGLGEKLISFGLEQVELKIEEFILVPKLVKKYSGLSLYDCVALAIAIERKITLLTGDAALRKAAKCENVKVIGTLGILDMLYENEHINDEEYLHCLNELMNNIGGKVRLPVREIENRLSRLKSKINV